jgi:hypothetical protein
LFVWVYKRKFEKFKEVSIGLGDPSSAPLTFVTKKIMVHRAPKWKFWYKSQNFKKNKVEENLGTYLNPSII